MGCQVTEDDYVMANAAYEACGDEMDKDLFCRLYKTKPLELVHALAGRVFEMERQHAYLRDEMRIVGESLVKAAEGVRRYEEGSDLRLDKLAIRLMGERNYLEKKLSEEDVTLTKADREKLTIKL